MQDSGKTRKLGKSEQWKSGGIEVVELELELESMESGWEPEPRMGKSKIGTGTAESGGPEVKEAELDVTI